MKVNADRIKWDKEFYSSEFEHSHLNVESDGQWLAELSGFDFDERWLQRINGELVGIGSVAIDSKFGVDGFLSAAAIESRKDFFESVLGWEDEGHLHHVTYMEMQEISPELFPLEKIIKINREIRE